MAACFVRRWHVHDEMLPLDELGTLAPGDTILVGLDQFVDEPIQIRGTRWNLDGKYTELEGVSITLLEQSTVYARYRARLRFRERRQ